MDFPELSPSDGAGAPSTLQDFEIAGYALSLLLDIHKQHGLGCEVLICAANELGISMSKLYDAIWAGVCEWDK